MPRDPLTKLAAIPHEAAEDFGFLKVDFLHLSAYNGFKSREEIERLVALEPNWSLLQLTSTHGKLFQLSKHGDMLKAVKPSSVEELADCMALIRPGKKAFLGLYTKERAAARVLLYAKDPESGYAFKKSHALAYALVVVLQLHQIEQGSL
jgi:DNA polymerase III alpha subunit